MTVTELLETAEFLIDNDGKRKKIVFDYAIWEELRELLEDLEDAEEMSRLRQSDEESISWEQAKAELRAEGVDV